MKQAKKILAVLLAMMVLCGFAAIGASAAETAVEAVATEQELKDLKGYAKVVIPLAVIEAALKRVPGFMKWSAFVKGSSYDAIQADLRAELKKANISPEDMLKYMQDGTIEKYSKEVVTYNKIMAEKAPAIFKKHCVFYVDWMVAIID